MLRDLHRQGLDVDLALHLREHAAFLHARRLADELDGHARLDRLVEPHFLEVDVRDVAADRILLVVLENRGVRGVLAFDDDVEDRVQPSLAGQHPAEVALRHGDGVGALALAVEDAGDEAGLAQAPGLA